MPWEAIADAESIDTWISGWPETYLDAKDELKPCKFAEPGRMPIGAVRAAYKHFYQVQQKGNNKYLSFVKVRDQDAREAVPAATKSRKRKGKGKAAAVGQPQAAAVAKAKVVAAGKTKAAAAAAAGAKAKAVAAEVAAAKAKAVAAEAAAAKAKAAAAGKTSGKGGAQAHPQVPRWRGQAFGEVNEQDLFDSMAELLDGYPTPARMMQMMQMVLALVRLSRLPNAESRLKGYLLTDARRASKISRAISCPAASTSDTAGHPRLERCPRLGDGFAASKAAGR